MIPQVSAKFFRDVLTDSSFSYDVFRVLACIGVAVYLLLALINYKHFDPQAFGIGFGAVLLAAGGAVRITQGSTGPMPSTTTVTDSTSRVVTTEPTV